MKMTWLRPPKNLLLLFLTAVTILCNYIDAFLTGIFLKNSPFLEFNPLMRMVLSHTGLFISIKFILVPGLCLVLLFTSKYNIARYALYLVSFLYTSLMLVWLHVIL